MGCAPSTNDRIMVPQPAHHHPHSSNQPQFSRLRMRLVINPADNGDNTNPKQMYKVISDIKKTPLLTLEQACQKLPVQNLLNCVAKAKNYSKHPKEGLKQEEQASINLYTQQTPFYQKLNDALRLSDGGALTPWYGYLKLFLTALHNLPPYRGSVWRGVPHGLSAKYRTNDEFVWWAFSSCTLSLNIFKSSNFLGDNFAGTLFNIEVFNARKISEFSEYFVEDEVLLLPGTHIRVVGELKQSDGLHIIQLKQIEPSYFLLEPSEQVDPTFKPVEQYKNQQKTIIHDEILNEKYISDQEYKSYEEYSKTQNTSTDVSLSAFNTQIQLAKNISSDSEKAQVLKHLLANKNLSDEMIAGVAECVETMSSSKEMADVLQLVAKRSGLTGKQFGVSVRVVSDISSDNPKAITLRAFLVHEQFTVQHLVLVLSAVQTMSSNAEKSNVFTDLIRNRYLNAQHFPSILNEIEDISSDANKSEVLCKLAPRLPKSDANVRQAYLRAADSISSSKEKAAATMAFASDSASKGMSTNDSLATFDTQIQLAKNISSDSEKAQVLKHLLANKNLSDEMIAGVAECVETMSSSKEMADVLQLVAKRSGLTGKQFGVSVRVVSDISSDNPKAITLRAFLVHEQFTVQHLALVLSAVHTMSSNAEKSNVFTDLIRNRYLNAQHFPSILNEIEDISSDANKSEVLCKLAPRLPKNDFNVQQAYLTAADSICASKEKAAATMAFM